MRFDFPWPSSRLAAAVEQINTLKEYIWLEYLQAIRVLQQSLLMGSCYPPLLFLFGLCVVHGFNLRAGGFML